MIDQMRKQLQKWKLDLEGQHEYPMPISSAFFLGKARSFYKRVRTKHGEGAVAVFSCETWSHKISCFVHSIRVTVEMHVGTL